MEPRIPLSLESRVYIDPTSLDRRAAYRLLTSLIVPRPIAWVGTRSPDGIDNLAPFSFFNGVSTHPPILSISVARDRAGLKDTAANILATEVFTVNVVGEHQVVAMQQSSGPYRADVSEFEATGLVPLPGQQVAAPRVQGAPACFECRLNRAIDLDTTHLFLGDIVGIHVSDDLLMEDGGVDPVRLAPVCRLGGQFASLGALHVLTPPAVSEEDRR